MSALLSVPDATETLPLLLGTILAMLFPLFFFSFLFFCFCYIFISSLIWCNRRRRVVRRSFWRRTNRSGVWTTTRCTSTRAAAASASASRRR